MTKQDREKRLAEIRVKAEFLDGCESKIEVNLPDLSKDIRFLLSELERKDEVVREVYEGNTNMRDALQDAANEIKKLREERDKLIDGLLTIINIASEDGVHWKLDRCYVTARDILKEIGVTVE